MDVTFGTHVCPDHEPEHFGLNEPTPSGYLGYLFHPFLPRMRKVEDSMSTANAKDVQPSEPESKPILDAERQATCC